MVASIAVGVEPVAGSIVHGVLLVLNKGEDTISRIDIKDNRLLGTVAVGGRIGSFTIGDGFGWALSYETRTISRIDPRENRVVERIPVRAEVGPSTSIAYGDHALWMTTPDGPVKRLDPETGRVVQTMEIRPLGLLVENGVLSTIEERGRLATYDARTGRRTGLLQLPAQGTGGDVGTTYAWVTISSDDVVLRIDVRTRRITARVPVGASPEQVIIGKRGIVWVTNLGDGTVSKIDGRRARVIATIDLGRTPLSIDVTPTGTPWVVVHE